MSLGTLLQTIIAVIFVYLILSLVASEIQEQIASIFEFRAKRLKESIKQLLGENGDVLTEPRPSKSQQQEVKSLTELLYEKYSIISLNQSATSIFSFIFSFLPFANKNRRNRKTRGPSYIKPKIFSQAILEVIQDNLENQHKLKKSDLITNTNPDDRLSVVDKLKKIKLNSPAISTLITIAEGLKLEQDEPNFSHFKAKLEELFQEAQERSSGVYKRNAKGLSLVLGLVIAATVNADAFYIVSSLSKENNNFREQIVNAIEENQSILMPNEDTQNDLSEEQREKIRDILDEIETLPLGWNLDDRDREDRKDREKEPNWVDNVGNQVNKQGGYIQTLFGWIISAIAIAMGAPFWFDLLGKVMRVRNAGKPEKTNSKED